MTSFDSGSFVMQLIIATPSPFKIIHRLVDLVADGIGDDAVMTFLENQRTKGMITKCRLNRHFVFAIQWNGFRYVFQPIRGSPSFHRTCSNKD